MCPRRRQRKSVDLWGRDISIHALRRDEAAPRSVWLISRLFGRVPSLESRNSGKDLLPPNHHPSSRIERALHHALSVHSLFPAFYTTLTFVSATFNSL